jgi:nucleoside-diphosphate-sugar epimerase
MKKVFIIGGPGNISRGIIDYLKDYNFQIGVYTRNIESKKKSFPHLKFYDGDRDDKLTLKKAFFDFGSNLVIDSICFNRLQAEDLYEIIKDQVRHLIFISTVDVYGYPLSRLPFKESCSFNSPIGDYAKKKREIELFYLEKFKEEDFPITIGRPSLSIGPDFCPMMFMDWGFKTIPKIKANMPIMIPGDGNGLMHVGWGYDVGRMIGRMIGDIKAIGKDYTLTSENCITRDDYISLYSKYLKANPERVYIPYEYIEKFKGVNNMTKIPHLYRYNMAFSLDKFKSDFNDYKWMPLENGVKEFIEENYKGNNFKNPEEEIIDDRIIAEWKKRLNDW